MTSRPAPVSIRATILWRHFLEQISVESSCYILYFLERISLAQCLPSALANFAIKHCVTFRLTRSEIYWTNQNIIGICLVGSGTFPGHFKTLWKGYRFNVWPLRMSFVTTKYTACRRPFKGFECNPTLIINLFRLSTYLDYQDKKFKDT